METAARARARARGGLGGGVGGSAGVVGPPWSVGLALSAHKERLSARAVAVKRCDAETGPAPTIATDGGIPQARVEGVRAAWRIRSSGPEARVDRPHECRALCERGAPCVRSTWERMSKTPSEFDKFEPAA